jgi:hypothetical protein
MRVQWPGEPQRLPTGTEDDMATKPVPAGCFIRRATGLVEGRRLEERDVAMGPEKSGRFLPGWARPMNLAPRRDSRSASSAGGTYSVINMTYRSAKAFDHNFLA